MAVLSHTARFFKHNYLGASPIHIHDNNNKKSLHAELTGAKSQLVWAGPRSVRVRGARVEAGFRDCAGIRGEWPPVSRSVFVSTLGEGFAGSHYLPPPLDAL